jgi:hypothetical protein
MRTRLLFLGGLIVALHAAAASAADPAIWLGPKASEHEKYAAKELQRYLYAAGDRLTTIKEAQKADGDGFVLGTPDTLPDLGIAWPFGLAVPADDGYIIRTISDGSRNLLIIAAPTPEGVRNGVYGLLEEIGFGFNLGGDTLPESAPSLGDLARRGMSESKTPAFKTRGAIPRFGSFCGASAWDPGDYRAYIDQLVHMRCNFVAFYISDKDPFAAYEFESKIIGGEPLPNTSRAIWGGRPTATDKFFAGTGQYFDKPFFGAASSFIDKREESIRAAKAVLRDALDYARACGIKTGIGFEIDGDPFAPDVQARFDARIQCLLKEYPAIDYLFLWEPENFGLTPPESPRPRSLWDGYARQVAGAFGDVPETDRKAEAARIAAFAMHAQSLVQALRPDVQLAVSGWGGDQWLHYTDFLPELDAVLPRDVILAGLDNMPATGGVSAAFGRVKPERVRWPILWYEHDGDLWLPQPNLDAVAAACRDARGKGAQGLLGVHWRTRDAEAPAGYVAQFAWDESLTPEKYVARQARNLAGEHREKDWAEVLARLQAQGYRWVGGNGTAAMAPFAWSAGDAEKRTTLAGILNDAPHSVSLENNPISLLLRGIHLQTPMAIDQSPTKDLIAYATFALKYSEAADKLAPGAGLEDLLDQTDSLGRLEFIRNSGLGDAMQIYARWAANKGELGALASMNAKAWADVRARAKLDDAAIAALQALPDAYVNRPDLLVLPDRVVVAGVNPEKLRVTLMTRPLGAKNWMETRLEQKAKHSFSLVFPESALRAGSFEYGVEIKVPRRGKMQWPQSLPQRGRTVHLTQPPKDAPVTPDAAPAPVTPPKVATQVAAERGALVLSWQPEPGVCYTVAREGKPLGTAYFGWFEDTQVPGGRTVQYEIKARHLKSGATASSVATAEVPQLPLPEPPKNIKIDARGNRVILGWDSDAQIAAKYYILKYGQDGKVMEETYVDADYGHFLQMSDQVDAGRAYEYSISGIAPDGRVGSPSQKVSIVSSTEPLAPILNLSFKDQSFLAGLATLNERGLALGGKGWAELPPQPEWDPGHALTLCVWVRLNDLNGTPVLICKGSWQRAGYFLQVNNGQIRFYLAGVDTIDAGAITAGKWHHVAATYGFGEMRIYVNGKLEGRKRVTGRPRASDDPLLIGRYGAGDDAYFVRGTMDDVRIYNVPLTPSELTTLFETTKPAAK